MRVGRRSATAAAVGIVLLASVWLAGVGRAADNEILVKFRAGAPSVAVRSLRAVNGVRVARAIPHIGTQVLTFDSAAAAQQALARFRASALVAYAEPNRRVHVLTIPNDYYYNTLVTEYFTTELIEGQWPLYQMDMEQAWSVAQGDPNVVVAVIDTGADLDHPDLAGMSVGAINIIEPAPGTPSQDDYGHGTAMAGCAVAHTNNTEGVAGVSWGCRLLSVKCLDDAGEGDFDDCAAGVIAAADWAGPGVVRVINMSWGDYYPSQTLQDAIDYAYGKGIVCVAAMGNDGDASVIWPAAANHVIAVGGTSIDGARSPLSNKGAHISVMAGAGDGYIGVLAPVPTYSTTISSAFEYDIIPYSLWDLSIDPDYPEYMLPLSGTSFSATEVSGVAALILSHTPSLTPAAVKALLELTATDMGIPGWDQDTGWGLVNAGAALAWEGPVLGSVEGTITDDLSGQPVEGVSLAASAPPRSAQSTSGADGVYTIGDLVAGDWTLTITAPGYVTQQQTAAVAAGAATTLDIVLEREVGDIAGTVVSASTGSPLAGVVVTLTQVGGQGSGVTTTAPDGSYSFLDLAVGTYQLTTDISGYLAQTRTAAVVFHQTTMVDFALVPKTGTISGRVTDSATGAPIMWARLEAPRTDGAGLGIAYTTDTGAYTIAGLPVGTYQVTASLEGYLNGRASGVTVTWNGTTTVNLQLEATPILVSRNLLAGWNLISLPVTPVDGSPPAVFGALPISGRLHRYDPIARGYVTYYDFDPGPFGEIQLGVGYWLYLDAATTVSVWGYVANGAQSLPLPAGGWALVGHPFRSAVALADCQVRRVSDGQVKVFAQSVGDGWIEQPAYAWDTAVLGYQTVGLEVPPYQDDRLRPWRGYWVSGGSDDVELVVPMP
jgi:serine protease